MTPEEFRKLKIGDKVIANLFQDGPLKCTVVDVPQSSGLVAIQKPNGGIVRLDETNCCYVRRVP